MWKRIRNWDAHHRLIAASFFAFGVGVFSYEHWPPAVLFVAIWNAFAVVLIVLSWVQIAFADQSRMMEAAASHDFGSMVMFCVVVGTSCASLFAVGYLLGSGRPSDHHLLLVHMFLSIATVVCSWVLIHTLFALHYAHLYHNAEHEAHEGVVIPGTDTPDYLDFVYFSFSIGMGFQPGDAQVTNRHIRHLVLLHGLISFVFNTAILALGVGCVSALIIGQ